VTRASKPPRSLLCKGGAAFPHFVAVQALAVAAVGGGFVEPCACGRRPQIRCLLMSGILARRRHQRCQGAVAEVLNAVYEADFLGFSHGLAA
jgi:hypothetical protein